MKKSSLRVNKRSIGIVILGAPLFMFAIIAAREFLWQLVSLSYVLFEPDSSFSLINFYYKNLFIFTFLFLLFMNLGINILRLRKRVRLFLVIFAVIYLFIISFIFTKIWINTIEGNSMSVRMLFYVNRISTTACLLLAYCIAAIHFFNNRRVKEQFNSQTILEAKRSVGLTIIGWLEAIIGSYHLLFGALFILRPLIWRISLSAVNSLSCWFNLIFGSYFLLTGIFTLRLKPSGRIMNLIGLSMYLAWQLKDIIGTFSYGILIDLLAIVYLPKITIIALLIYYFTLPKLKNQFK